LFGLKNNITLQAESWISVCCWSLLKLNTLVFYCNA